MVRTLSPDRWASSSWVSSARRRRLRSSPPRLVGDSPPPARQERITLTLRVRWAVSPMAVTLRSRIAEVPGLG
jgi:hypothetical protein